MVRGRIAPVNLSMLSAKFSVSAFAAHVRLIAPARRQ
jgi:hypothetical protein